MQVDCVSSYIVHTLFCNLCKLIIVKYNGKKIMCAAYFLSAHAYMDQDRVIALPIEFVDTTAVLATTNSQKFDVVCNLAAQAGVRYSITNPYAYIESNIIGYINILEAVRHNNVGHFLRHMYGLLHCGLMILSKRSMGHHKATHKKAM